MQPSPLAPKGRDFMSTEPLLNGKQLAAALGRCEHHVLAMRRAGYRFKHHSLGKTTLQHALDALDASDDFKAKHYLSKGWERLPKCLAAKESQPV